MTSVPWYRVRLPIDGSDHGGHHVRGNPPVDSPAPAPEGPIVCTLQPNDYAGRLADFRQTVFSRLTGMERPEPTRLRLLLAAGTDPGSVRELLVREQACCAFLGFTITGDGDRLVVDLQVPTEAAPVLDAMAGLAELAAPARRPSGQRQYPEAAVGRLRTIKAAERLGFTLAEIEELLDLSEHRRGTRELRRHARAKLAEIDTRIDQLAQMRRALEGLLAADCDSLTDCSCGLGGPLPDLGAAGQDGQDAPVALR